MPNTDIDGSPIVILSQAEAHRIYEYLYDIAAGGGLDELDKKIVGKIAHALDLPVF